MLKKLFGGGENIDLKTFHQQGATIVDVRTPQEFASGHIKGAINIPLDTLDRDYKKIKQPEKGVITCCASGMRSSVGKRILKSKGINAQNGGGWSSLQHQLK